MRASILVVEDERHLADILRSALREAGYGAQSASNADAAYAFLQQGRFDLVLMDLRLPGILGFKLLEMIRGEPQTARLPVMILTALGEEKHKLQAFRNGADDYLVKPFSWQELLARVQALLRRPPRNKFLGAR